MPPQHWVTAIFAFYGSCNITSFAAERRMVCQSIMLASQLNFSRLIRLSVPRLHRRLGFAVQSCLACYFRCTNSIFHLLALHHTVTSLPLFATASSFYLHPRPGDEVTFSFLAFSVDFCNFWNKNNTLWRLFLHPCRPGPHTYSGEQENFALSGNTTDRCCRRHICVGETLH